MIISVLLSFLGTVLNFFIFFLPSKELLPINISDGFQWIVETSYQFDGIVPVSTIFSIVSTLFVFHIAMFGWSGVNWLIGKIRGSN